MPNPFTTKKTRLYLDAVRRDFPAGSRVELRPHLDAWMQGDRFGSVVKVASTGRIHVKMDRSGRTLRMFEHSLTPLS